MRKLKQYVSALMMAGILLATASCVSDNESASVTELRGATSKKLQAEADLNTAQAAAATILANATKVQAEAQAALLQAQANWHAAQTAAQEAKTQIEKDLAAVNLEAAKQDLAVVKERAALRIQRLKDELEQQKLNAQVQLKNLELALADATEGVSAQIRAELASYIAAYTSLLNEVNVLKDEVARKGFDLIEQNALLADLKAGEQDALAQFIKGRNQDIDANTKQIAIDEESLKEWTALKTNYADNVEPTIAAKEADWKKFDAERTLAWADYQKKQKAGQDAYTAYDDFRWEVYNIGWTSYGSLEELNIKIAELETTLANQKKAIADSTTSLNTAKAKVATSYKEQNDSIAAYDAASKDVTLKIAARDKANDAVNAATTSAELATANANLTLAEAALLTAQNAEGVAWTKMDNAQSRYTALLSTISNLESQLLSLKNSQVNTENSIADKVKLRDDFDGISNKLQTLWDAYLAADKVTDAANVAYWDLNSKVNLLQADIDALKLILIAAANGYQREETMSKVQLRIDGLTDAIEYMTAQNVQYARDITAAKAGTAEAISILDQDITKLTAEIATLNVKIGLKEKELVTAKAAVDARLK